MKKPPPRKKVLIAPLHWGLGHASRCIPLIREQLTLGNEVLIAAHGGPKALLQSHFPNALFVDIPFMTISYPRDGNMVRHFFIKGPKLLVSIIREHIYLQRLIGQEQVKLVISDSRFGLWTKRCKCVFVTHQVHIKSPVAEGLINLLNRWVMRRYTEVWIPDYAAFPGLAGELSHPRDMPRNAKYIGPLSRFSKPLVPSENKRWKAVALISGPEPLRSLFEAELAARFIESDEPALMLRGKPEEETNQVIGNLQLVSHLKDEDLINALAQCEKVMARSGYSTIMDLHVLGTKAEWHPTPGQTEQEYLAQLHPSQLD